jgi:hypothetical protein
MIKKYPSQEACFGVTLTPELLKEIDKIREDLPRSVFIRRALNRYHDDLKKGNVTLLQSASLVGTPERNAVSASQLVRRNNNNDIAREAVEAAASVSSPPTTPSQEGTVSVSR